MQIITHMASITLIALAFLICAEPKGLAHSPTAIRIDILTLANLLLVPALGTSAILL